MLIIFKVEHTTIKGNHLSSLIITFENWCVLFSAIASWYLLSPTHRPGTTLIILSVLAQLIFSATVGSAWLVMGWVMIFRLHGDVFMLESVSPGLMLLSGPLLCSDVGSSSELQLALSPAQREPLNTVLPAVLLSCAVQWLGGVHLFSFCDQLIRTRSHRKCRSICVRSRGYSSVPLKKAQLKSWDNVAVKAASWSLTHRHSEKGECKGLPLKTKAGTQCYTENGVLLCLKRRAVPRKSSSQANEQDHIKMWHKTNTPGDVDRNCRECTLLCHFWPLINADIYTYLIIDLRKVTVVKEQTHTTLELSKKWKAFYFKMPIIH